MQRLLGNVATLQFVIDYTELAGHAIPLPTRGGEGVAEVGGRTIRFGLLPALIVAGVSLNQWDGRPYPQRHQTCQSCHPA